MSDQPTQLEASILRTICWFSVFEYPLTSFEIWKWLLEPDHAYDLAQVARVLEQSAWLQERLVFSNGFFTMKEMATHEANIAMRRDRFLNAARKYQRLRRASMYFSMLPGVRSVSAVNTMSWWHTSDTSDIDLFIVTRPGSIWSSRFFLVAPFALLGQRPAQHGLEDVADPFCFSFFVTPEHLQLESLKCSNKDHYLAFWLKSIVPMFDKDQQLETFEKENKWASVVLPNARVRSTHQSHRPKQSLSFPIQPRFLERAFRSIQQRRMPMHLVELANKDTRVVVNDTILKFHENDRREQFMQRYQDTLARYL